MQEKRKKLLEIYEKEKKIREEAEKKKQLPINFTGFEGKLPLLIDGIREIPNYNVLKGYIREKIIPKHPNIDYEQLSIIAGIHPGVALVILYDLYMDKLESELRELEKDMYPADFEEYM